MEKPGRHNFNQVFEVKITNAVMTKGQTACSFLYDAPRRTHHFSGIPSPNAYHELVDEKTAHKSKVRNIPQNN